MSFQQYNSSDDIFRGITAGNHTDFVISITSIGIGLYLIELILIIIWIITNRVYMVIHICNIGNIISKYDIKIPHLILIPLSITCIYKFISLGVVLYTQSISTTGVEILCFIILDIIIYDIIFTSLLLVFCRIILNMPINKRILYTIQIMRVVICICTSIMFIGCIFTLIVFLAVKDVQIFVISIYSITLPLIAVTRIVLLLAAIFLSCTIIFLARTTNIPLTIKMCVILMLCVVIHILYIILIPLAYILSMIILILIHVIPGVIVNLLLIIAFAPNANAWSRFICRDTRNTV